MPPVVNKQTKSVELPSYLGVVVAGPPGVDERHRRPHALRTRARRTPDTRRTAPGDGAGRGVRQAAGRRQGADPAGDLHRRQPAARHLRGSAGGQAANGRRYRRAPQRAGAGGVRHVAGLRQPRARAAAEPVRRSRPRPTGDVAPERGETRHSDQGGAPPRRSANEPQREQHRQLRRPRSERQRRCMAGTQSVADAT